MGEFLASGHPIISDPIAAEFLGMMVIIPPFHWTPPLSFKIRVGFGTARLPTTQPELLTEKQKGVGTGYVSFWIAIRDMYHMPYAGYVVA